MKSNLIRHIEESNFKYLFYKMSLAIDRGDAIVAADWAKKLVTYSRSLGLTK